MTADLEKGREGISFSLHDYGDPVHAALAALEEAQVMRRIWDHDHRVWKPGPAEITNRLGWLHIAGQMIDRVPQIERFVGEVTAAGYTHALLLGMGGSSLAPEVFSRTFGTARGHLDLAILDSTDPAAVTAHAHRLEPGQTLFIVSTKSGTTPETLSFFRYFYNWIADALGREQAGDHFIAITDPGSHLTDVAKEYGFRASFENDPTIGGRYSALSYFGMVPAALAGIDVSRLLNNALSMTDICSVEHSPGSRLGIVLGELAQGGRNKVTFVVSPQIESFGDWVEQLLAESTGKEGKGIVPVVGETIGTPDSYESDRLFVHIALEADETHREQVKLLDDAGHPVVRIGLGDPYDLGGQFFLWEMATAVAGHVLGINPFDQPDVESTKILTGRAVEQYRKEGSLPDPVPAAWDASLAVHGDHAGKDVAESLRAFLRNATEGSYAAIQAYVPPSGAVARALQALRMKIRDTCRIATTLGYGPRFLHSTGQLHKGDGGKGLFMQITSDDTADVPIPDRAGEPGSALTFGILKSAQVLGDWQALRAGGRRVIRFHVKGDIVEGINRLQQMV